MMNIISERYVDDDDDDNDDKQTKMYSRITKHYQYPVNIVS